MNRKFWISTLCGLSMSAGIGCFQSNYRVPIWDGYRLVKSNSRERVIINSEDVVMVSGNVRMLGFDRPWIVGTREQPTGLFILNTQSGLLEFFTETESFDQRRNALGISGVEPREIVSRTIEIPIEEF